jgi:MerR family copper efflux transcriptional regulator
MTPSHHTSSLVKIGVIASTTGLSTQTLRYYQTRGLIQPKQYLESGYRLYEISIIERIKFIQHSKTIGFSLDEVLELLKLQDDPNVGAGQVKQKIDAKVTALDLKIAKLQQIKQSLIQLSNNCSGEGAIADCPIIAELKS